MDSTILYEYLENNSLDKENLIINYSFEEIENGVVYNEIYSNADHYPAVGCLDSAIYPGIVVSCVDHPEFESFKGCCSMGYFDSNTVIRLGNEVSYDSWSVFINYNNNVTRDDRNKAEVILSSMDGPTALSGFHLGLNGANRLYFEYVNVNGIIKNIVLPREVELYNLISISKSDNVISISNHDPFSRKNYNVDYSLNDFVDSNVWTLGGYYDTGTHTRYRGFKGFVDDFLLFDTELSVIQRDTVSEALYFTGILPAYEKETSKIISTISGAPTITSKATSAAVTGFEMLPITEIETVCETPITVCKKVELTGAGYEDVLDFARVDIEVADIEIIPEERLFNEVYTSKYAEKNIVFLKNIDLKDIYQIHSQSEYDDDLNKLFEYDTAYSSYNIDAADKDRGLSVFINGVYSLKGESYSLDETFLSSGTSYIYETTDSLIYDASDNDSILYEYDGEVFPEFSVVGTGYTNKDIYFRGQKLLSGQDYVEFHNDPGPYPTGVTIYPWEEDDSGVTGIYSFVPYGVSRGITYTGSVDAYDMLNFNLRNEQVWLNGYRQIEDIDYLKTSEKSLLNGNIRLESKSHSIYNNSEDFWNFSTSEGGVVTTTTTTSDPGGTTTTTTTTSAPGGGGGYP